MEPVEDSAGASSVPVGLRRGPLPLVPAPSVEVSEAEPEVMLLFMSEPALLLLFISVVSLPEDCTLPLLSALPAVWATAMPPRAGQRRRRAWSGSSWSSSWKGTPWS
ncbi:hypothetical protein HK414_20030 [Ramlibacter terrae]|uniref:Uncharacterized protein n=1 Tax=Ramlibacter terrae TaxID=2732511 RepID=A0ABX6P5N4_9BURK|nr:hypothetical protein HK414_20030 [Ramlibacter terrae]